MYLLKRNHHIHQAFVSEQELPLTIISHLNQHWLLGQMVGCILHTLKCSEGKSALYMVEKAKVTMLWSNTLALTAYIALSANGC